MENKCFITSDYNKFKINTHDSNKNHKKVS